MPLDLIKALRLVVLTDCAVRGVFAFRTFLGVLVIQTHRDSKAPPRQPLRISVACRRPASGNTRSGRCLRSSHKQGCSYYGTEVVKRNRKRKTNLTTTHPETARDSDTSKRDKSRQVKIGGGPVLALLSHYIILCC